MFFSFIKMLIYYLILRAVITDGYNVITNLALGGQCELENKVGDHLCTDGLWSRASAYNKLDQ